MSEFLPMQLGSLVVLRPLWLLALVLLPLFWRFSPQGGAERGAWRQVVDARLLPFLIQGNIAQTSSSPRPYLIAALALAILGLSGPAWDQQPLPLAHSQSARVAVFDLSPSMGAADLKPDRLTRARFKLIDWLKQHKDGQTGLVVFGGQAFAVAPLTSDNATLINLAEVLDPDLMPLRGARADLGIAEAMRLLEGANITGGEIVLFTDGINRAAVQMEDTLRQRDIRVSVLAVGTAAGAPIAAPGGGFIKDAQGNIVLPKLDRQRLQGLTSATGGRYAQITADGRDLALLRSDQDRELNQLPLLAEGAEQRQSSYWVDRGPWLLLAALPFCALCFRRGWFLLALLMIAPQFAAPTPAMAQDAVAEANAQAQPENTGFGWRDLWLRRDQQAFRAMQESDYARAEALAPEPARRGAAAAAAERWKDAAEHFAKADGAPAEDAYNEGTALAQAGKYAEALEALDRALSINPDHADALANKQAIEDWLRQQQQDQQQDGEKQDQQQGEQQDGEQQQGQQQDGEQQQGQQQDGEQQQGQQQDGEQQQGDQQQDSQQQDAQQQSEQGKDPQQESEQAAGQQSGDDQQQTGEQQQGEQSDQDNDDADSEQTQPSPSSDPEEPAEDQQQTNAQAQAQEGDGNEANSQAAQLQELDELDPEQRQALEQWLQRVPDDPGGLLRRKFQMEARRRPPPPDSADEEDSQW
ncbi:MAG: VWA domain-containing protein [Xanthomonadales bacterium]|nr:VWA domain-containing protein [Xanthomonadales bacterium]